MLLIPFNVSFLGREDHTLEMRLVGELPGIANWALEGLRRLNSRGRFTEPQISKEELQDMAEGFSPVRQFFTEVCVLGPGETPSKALHSTYVAWTIREGAGQPMTQTALTSAVKALTRGMGPQLTRFYVDGKEVRGFRGFSLRAVESQTTSAFKPEIVKP